MKAIVHRMLGRNAEVPILLLAAALLIVPLSGQAARFDNLYTVVVTADLTAEDPLEVGTQAAMAELLVRLTGRRGVQSDPAVFPMLESASRFVEQWGYQTADEMVLTFDAPAVESELRRLNLPLWGSERPLTLLWVVFDSGNGRRQLLGPAPAEDAEDAEDAGAMDGLAFLRESIEDTAAERGLPTLLPLLDEEDQAALAAADVWAGFNDRIEAASRRYGADAILIGRIRSAGGANAARWSLLTGDDFRERRGTVRDGIDWLADTYAQQFAVSGGTQRRKILVSEVTNFDDYGRVIAFMEKQSLFDSVSVDEVMDDALLLSVRMRGDARVLQRAMRLGNVLRPMPPPRTPQASIADAYFRVAR
jgi:hypothetical protein